MFSTLNLKTLHPLQSSSSSSSSALTSTKLKISLIRTLIVSHMCRLIRALSKLKTTIVNTLRENNHNHYSSSSSSKSKNNSKFPKNTSSNNNTTQKIILGSFRLHYNWCSSNSSHVFPVPTRVYQGLKQPSSTGNSRNSSSHFNNYEQQQKQQQQGVGVVGGDEYWAELELAGYLQWLEENDDDEEYNGKEMNEIDMLAEMFIANGHERFRLEKQESDRKFHEMLARGL